MSAGSGTRPPSARKLRRERAQGRFSRSADIVGLVVLSAVVASLILAYRSIESGFARMFAVAESGTAANGAIGADRAMAAMLDTVATGIGPVLFVAACAAALGSVLANRGMILTLAPILPRLSRLSPGPGLSRVFSLRSAALFLAGLVKAALLFGATGYLAWQGGALLLQVPDCGARCAGPAFVAVAAPLALAILAIYTLAAVSDAWLQHRLFLREMRMTPDEERREAREDRGDPAVIGARRRTRIEAARGRPQADSPIRRILVSDGDKLAVEVLYQRGGTPVPVIARRGKGSAARAMIDAAPGRGLCHVDRPELARRLSEIAGVDAAIPRSLWRTIAPLLGTGTR